MGLLGLRALVYMARHHNGAARNLVRPDHDHFYYPFAIAGINLAHDLLTNLNDPEHVLLCNELRWEQSPPASSAACTGECCGGDPGRHCEHTCIRVYMDDVEVGNEIMTRRIGVLVF